MTSQCNLNGRWLGFQQSAAVPRVRQVRYRVSMGNFYGLLPLQRIRKPSASRQLGACTVNKPAERRLECAVDVLRKMPLEQPTRVLPAV